MQATQHRYRERLTVPLRWWVQTTMLVATFWLAVVVALPAAAAWTVTGVAMALAALLLLGIGSAVVCVEGGVLRAGRARIELHHLGAVEALDPETMRRLAGRDADARAFLLLRPYVKGGVRVWVQDPADPTPYWLVSSRHPRRLAEALGGTSSRHG